MTAHGRLTHYCEMQMIWQMVTFVTKSEQEKMEEAKTKQRLPNE
jgi:hypothetical protein